MTEQVPESAGPLPKGQLLCLDILFCDEQQQPCRYVSKFWQGLQSWEVFALKGVDLVSGLAGEGAVLDSWARMAPDEADGVVVKKEQEQG